MSKPRYRWVTRCMTNDCRRLWRRKPHLVKHVPAAYPMYQGHWDDGSWSGMYSEGRTQAYVRRRFGRDLRPGEIRRLK